GKKSIDRGIFYNDIFPPPQRHVRQVFGDNSLGLSVDELSLGQIGCAASPIQQAVKIGVPVMTEVVAVRRRAGGMKNLIHDVRIHDTDPGQRVEMRSEER